MLYRHATNKRHNFDFTQRQARGAEFKELQQGFGENRRAILDTVEIGRLANAPYYQVCRSSEESNLLAERKEDATPYRVFVRGNRSLDCHQDVKISRLLAQFNWSSKDARELKINS